MEIPMMGLGKTETDIETQYEQGPPAVTDMSIPGQPSYEEWKKQQSEMVEKMKTEIDDLRLVSEYNRLMVEGEELTLRQMEAKVMLGQVDITTLPECPKKWELMVRIDKAAVMAGRKPVRNSEGQLVIQGLAGLELAVNETQAQDYLTRKQVDIQQAVQMHKEKELQLQEVSLKTGLELVILYTPDPKVVGQINALVQGKDIETAEPMELPEGITTITFQVPNGDRKSDVSMNPGDYIVKCKDGVVCVLTSEDYQKWSK